jgi:hypothetical protein
MAMKQGDAGEGQSEQNEVEGNAKDHHGLGAMIAARFACTKCIGPIFIGRS